MSVSVGGNASRVRTSSVPRRAGFVTRAPAQAPSAEVTAPATTTKTATSRVRSNSVPRQRAGSVTRAPTSTKEAVSIAPQPSAQDQVCGAPHSLRVSVEWWALDGPGISSDSRLCTSSHEIQDSRSHSDVCVSGTI